MQYCTYTFVFALNIPVFAPVNATECLNPALMLHTREFENGCSVNDIHVYS